MPHCQMSPSHHRQRQIDHMTTSSNKSLPPQDRPYPLTLVPPQHLSPPTTLPLYYLLLDSINSTFNHHSTHATSRRQQWISRGAYTSKQTSTTEIDRSWVFIVLLKQYKHIIQVIETSLDRGFWMIGNGKLHSIGYQRFGHFSLIGNHQILQYACENSLPLPPPSFVVPALKAYFWMASTVLSLNILHSS